MTQLTENERALLRHLALDVGNCIADPEYGVQHLRDSHGQGGGHGFTYRLGPTAIVGRWHEWVPVAWDAGHHDRPIRWREGALLREAKVSHRRLRQWCESLPAEVRAQALTWWKTSPEDTRDLEALRRLTVQQLADPEPADLLELLEDM